MQQLPPAPIVGEAHKLFREGNYSRALQLYRLAGASLGSRFFEANMQICRSRHYERITKEATDLHNIKQRTNKRGIRYCDSYVVAIIADEFTANSLRQEFITVFVNPDSWRKSFEQYKPDLFFCESAWSGADSIERPWKGQIYASKNFKTENRTALLHILKHCRDNGIPTIFWNKEDPTHFNDRIHDFAATAKEFDYVFTSAAECIEDYKNHHGINNIFALPFATNPHLFNPIEIGPRSDDLVFAGSWYANHRDRSNEMESILDSTIRNGYKLRIYDRHYGSKDELHIWPKKYQVYLHPARPHNEMPAVYKSSRLGLNFNTVTNSSTMFARRVFELMSSNTLVVSNYSKGCDQMFGDLLIFPDKDPNRLNELSDEDIDNIREKALCSVLASHTYRHRWQHILTCIGIDYAARDDCLTVVSEVSCDDEAIDSIAWFQQKCSQLGECKLLLIASEQMNDLRIAELYMNFNKRGITVTSRSHAKRYSILDRYNPIETSHFLVISKGFKPESEWINRSMLHLQYAEDYFIGIARNKHSRYKLSHTEPGSTVLAARHLFGHYLNREGKPLPCYFI